MPHSSDTIPPLLSSSKHKSIPPTAIVIFGASGDLTARKLIPAIYNLSLDKLLPSDFFLIGFGRKSLSNQEFQQITSDNIQQFSRRQLDPKSWSKVLSNSSYFQGDYSTIESFHALNSYISDLEKSLNKQLQVLFYISTPPDAFLPILQNLGSSGLSKRYLNSPFASKVIIEKPFGKNLLSAQTLNRTILDQFDEKQVFRIDHYLGKETVQDLLVQRFANSIFEPIWNLNYVDHVEITVAEELGVGSRGAYYDQSGALRDMIQNHIMQIIALIAMEPPISSNPEDIRSEKVKLLKAIQPVNLDPANPDIVRAQYTEGLINSKPVPAYRQESNVATSSFTETYVALRLYINNWRWHGVPFYVRTGKRLPKRASEVAIHFRLPPGKLFNQSISPNSLIIQIQPNEGCTLLLNSKIPGLDTRLQTVHMHFDYATAFGSNTPEAYERLILDSLLGDSTLFIRNDETETSWKICTPILEFWQNSKQQGLEFYPAGSWGPNGADHLLWKNGHAWRKP